MFKRHFLQLAFSFMESPSLYVCIILICSSHIFEIWAKTIRKVDNIHHTIEFKLEVYFSNERNEDPSTSIDIIMVYYIHYGGCHLTNSNFIVKRALSVRS